IAQYKRTGKHLGVFDSPESATVYANSLHEDQAKQYSKLPKVQSFDPSFFTTPPTAEPMGPPANLAGPSPTQSDQAIGDMPPDFGTGGGPLDTSGFAPAMATVGHQISAAMPRTLAAGEAGLIQFGANVAPALAAGMGNPMAGPQ